MRPHFVACKTNMMRPVRANRSESPFGTRVPMIHRWLGQDATALSIPGISKNGRYSLEFLGCKTKLEAAQPRTF
jgi:hypothetical protein